MKLKKSLYKRITSLMIVLCLILSSLGTSAKASSDRSDISGQCGKNLTYTYDSGTNCLTISGTGDMDEYSGASDTPWADVQSRIKKLVVNEGVTSLGAYAFYKAISLTEVILPEGLHELGTYTFGLCSALREITLPEGLEIIGSKTFRKCTGLKSIELPGTLTNIDMKAFEDAGRLKDVYYHGTQVGWDQIVISTSAQGNQTLLRAELHFLDSAQTFNDVGADSPYLEAVTYLTDNGYVSAESDHYGIDETADTEMIMKALYHRAGRPGMYSTVGEWGMKNGLLSSEENESLTVSGLAYILYREAVLNGTAEDGLDGISWCNTQGYFTGIDHADKSGRALNRGEASLILEAYLKSTASFADRKEKQIQTMKSALAQGGDGRLYVYVPDLTTENAPSKPGDSTLVILPDGKTMMIDFGVNTSEAIVLDMLKTLGVSSLDYIVVSHPHSDHLGNSLAVASYLKNAGGSVGKIYYSGYDLGGRMQSLIGALPDAEAIQIQKGDVLQFGDVSVEIFNPDQKQIDEVKAVAKPGDDLVNNVSLTMKFTYGESTYMTCGDLYEKQEKELIAEYGERLQADVVKSNHHGAYTSNSEEWLNTINPLLTFVESDDIGSTPLSRMAAARGTAFYAFGLDGSILISMDNHKDYQVVTQKDSVIRSGYTGQIGRANVEADKVNTSKQTGGIEPRTVILICLTAICLCICVGAAAVILYRKKKNNS